MLTIKTEKQREHVERIINVLAKKDGVSVFENGIKCDTLLTFDEMAEVIDYIRSSEPSDEEFEECWKAYRRKGSKKKAKEYWNKLSDKDRKIVLPHVKIYVSSRDLAYQRDFERYLRDKVFKTIIVQGNRVLFDPTKGTNDSYRPELSPLLCWNDYYKCYIYLGYFDGHISDGYSDDLRPEGACVHLNNGRGVLYWSKQRKIWVNNKS